MTTNRCYGPDNSSTPPRRCRLGYTMGSLSRHRPRVRTLGTRSGPPLIAAVGRRRSLRGAAGGAPPRSRQRRARFAGGSTFRVIRFEPLRLPAASNALATSWTLKLRGGLPTRRRLGFRRSALVPEPSGSARLARTSSLRESRTPRGVASSVASISAGSSTVVRNRTPRRKVAKLEVRGPLIASRGGVESLGAVTVWVWVTVGVGPAGGVA